MEDDFMCSAQMVRKLEQITAEPSGGIWRISFRMLTDAQERFSNSFQIDINYLCELKTEGGSIYLTKPETPQHRKMENTQCIDIHINKLKNKYTTLSLSPYVYIKHICRWGTAW